MNLGTTIKNIRQKKGYRQNAFANKCSITPAYLSQIENSQRDPKISTLKVIAENLGLPLPFLLFLSVTTDDISPSKRQAFAKIENSIRSVLIEFINTKPTDK